MRLKLPQYLSIYIYMGILLFVLVISIFICIRYNIFGARSANIIINEQK
jgi:hypothetical protein